MTKASSLINREIKNFNQFKSYVGRYGFSLTNFYDVQFLMANPGSNFITNIFTKGNGLNSSTTSTISELMRLYADECSIPGYAIATGDYRITNSPTLKYAYGIVNNELTISFISDADSEIRQIFDAWGNYIYSGVTSSTAARNALNINSINDLGRTRYKDDYILDIVIVKLERFASSTQNTRLSRDGLTKELGPSTNIPLSRIFPGTDTTTTNTVASQFGEAIQKYAIRLKNAFPTTVSAIPLNSGSSQLVKIQVTFEYDMAVPASQTGGTVEASGNWNTVVG